jgi:hypothetical protein
MQEKIPAKKNTSQKSKPEHVGKDAPFPLRKPKKR